METIMESKLDLIAGVLGVPRQNITDPEWLDIGMTNNSFCFTAAGRRYIVRIPGDGSEAYIARRQEAAVYAAITPLAISDEPVYFNPATGDKITLYYPNSHVVAEDDWPRIQACMGLLRRLHSSGIRVAHRFNILQKLDEYERMCRAAGCLDPAAVASARRALARPLAVIAGTKRPLTLCHVDCAHVNYLVKEDDSICLLDWEYAGMCHDVADPAMFCLFSGYEPEDYSRLLGWLLGRTPTAGEVALCFSYAAAGGLLWHMWARYREHYGEDFGDYTPRMLRECLRLAPLAEKQAG